MANKVLLRLGYPNNSIDKTVNGSPEINVYRSLVGMALQSGVNDGIIVINPDKTYSLADGKEVLIDPGKCKEAIDSLLVTPKTKKELYESLIHLFGADETNTLKDDNNCKCIAGQILAEEVRHKRIVKRENRYSISAPKKKEPPMANLAEFKELFMKRLYKAGGPFFESFSANLLEKYYLCTGRVVSRSEVVGGSEDGGIDVLLDVEDDLGFVEHVMVQCKNRKPQNVIAEKEIREFYGALKLKDGSRGIYMTTSKFCDAASVVLHRLDNCIGIDGDKVFSLCLSTGFGIESSEQGYSFDESCFPDSEGLE